MRLVDTSTAARAVGVTERTIRRWVKAGVVPNQGTSRRILIDLDRLETARAIGAALALLDKMSPTMC